MAIYADVVSMDERGRFLKSIISSQTELSSENQHIILKERLYWDLELSRGRDLLQHTYGRDCPQMTCRPSKENGDNFV